MEQAQSANTIIYKSRIRVRYRSFKLVLEKRLPGQLGGASGIAGGLVHEFWAALDSREMPYFLDKLKSRGHRLIASWGEETLLGEHEKQKTPWLIPEGELRQWQQALESCQQWQPQMSRFVDVISWNLGPMFLSEAMPYIARTMDKGTAIVILQEILMQRKKNSSTA